jgi:hypothetical protein
VVIEQIWVEIKNFLELNKNESTNYHNLWDIAKAVLRRKFIAMNVYAKNTERCQINKRMLHLKHLEKQEQTKLKTNKREIIKIRQKSMK